MNRRLNTLLPAWMSRLVRNAEDTWWDYRYPIWAMTGGTFINTFGGSMVFPIFTLYFTSKFGLIGVVSTSLLFEAAIIILTLGEMVIIPASQTLAADLAPVEMRGRYQAVYGLMAGLGFGVGPVLAGALFDAGAGRWIWIGSLILSLAVAAGYRAFGPRLKARQARAV